MEREGVFAPETPAAARQRYAMLAPAASELLSAVTREMGFDAAEYDRRVTDAVEATARDALFASLLEVRVGTRNEYETWRDQHDGDVLETGSENVDSVAWHVGPTGTAVAATFQSERDAAVGTLRRQAFGRLYSEVVR
jgi:hypothetical protein